VKCFTEVYHLISENCDIAGAFVMHLLDVGMTYRVYDLLFEGIIHVDVVAVGATFLLG
jgi:hypothetical protein